MTVESRPIFYNEVTNCVKFVLKDGVFDLTSIDHFEKNFNSAGFGVKFVTQGVERYKVNKQLYTVREGNYLLLNGEKESSVEINSQKHVKGMCFQLSDALISQVVASFKAPDTPFSDQQLSSFFLGTSFLENKYATQGNALGVKLMDLHKQVVSKELFEDQLQEEFFFELASAVVIDQISVFKELQNIKSVKEETKRELFRRVNQGREFIDTCFEKPLTIEEIAQFAGMSEFHFFRLFRQTFGLSPYQYLTKKRFEQAIYLLSQGQSISAVAIESGFSSIHSFSKSFKKVYGVSPSNHFQLKPVLKISRD
jgi:AraC family transcriptional regulator